MYVGRVYHGPHCTTYFATRGYIRSQVDAGRIDCANENIKHTIGPSQVLRHYACCYWESCQLGRYHVEQRLTLIRVNANYFTRLGRLSQANNLITKFLLQYTSASETGIEYYGHAPEAHLFYTYAPPCVPLSPRADRHIVHGRAMSAWVQPVTDVSALWASPGGSN